MAQQGRKLQELLESCLAAALDFEVMCKVRSLVQERFPWPGGEDLWWATVATQYALQAAGGDVNKLRNHGVFANVANGWALRDMHLLPDHTLCYALNALDSRVEDVIFRELVYRGRNGRLWIVD